MFYICLDRCMKFEVGSQWVSQADLSLRSAKLSRMCHCVQLASSKMIACTRNYLSLKYWDSVEFLLSLSLEQRFTLDRLLNLQMGTNQHVLCYNIQFIPNVNFRLPHVYTGSQMKACITTHKIYFICTLLICLIIFERLYYSSNFLKKVNCDVQLCSKYHIVDIRSI